MTERRPRALCAGVGSAGLVDNASALRCAARRRGVVITRLRCRRFLRDLRGQAPSMNAQRVKRACSVSNIARTAGASAAASVRVDFAQRATNEWPSPISSSREVIAQIHPDATALGKSHGRRRGRRTHDRIRGDLTAATGDHVTVDSRRSYFGRRHLDF
jgi:hypothetical protein